MLNNKQITDILGWCESQLEFNEEDHLYTCDGKDMTSVSKYIEPWNMAFSHMMNPTHKNYNHKLASSMSFFQNRGTMVHALSEEVDKGFNNKWPAQYWDYELYYKQFYNKMIKSGKWEVVAIEARILSKTLSVAGTVDRLYRDTETKEIILMDVKTGATQDINLYQQALYCYILKEQGIDVKQSYLLSLKKGCHLKLIPQDVIKAKQQEILKYYEKGGVIMGKQERTLCNENGVHGCDASKYHQSPDEHEFITHSVCLKDTLDKLKEFEQEHLTVLEGHKNLKDKIDVYKNLLKGFGNMEITYKNTLFKSTIVKSERLDSKKLKTELPEVYNNYIKTIESKRLLVKEIKTDE